MTDSELLDIAQAAAFLQVSPASLRRWTNAGRLRCYRVGGRRERRFRRADLLAFMESSGGAVSPDAHAHRCDFYLDAAEREAQAVAFLAVALATGNHCVLVVEPKVGDRILARLGERRPDARDAVETGRLTSTTYVSRVALQMERWQQLFDDVTRAGATAVQVVGDVSGGGLARGGNFPKLLDYERRYEAWSQSLPITTLCLYDARRLSGVQATRMLNLHHDHDS